MYYIAIINKKFSKVSHVGDDSFISRWQFGQKGKKQKKSTSIFYIGEVRPEKRERENERELRAQIFKYFIIIIIFIRS